MYETLQKIGMPAAIAASIVVLVMMVPFLFKIDERYAKAAELQAQISRLEAKNDNLRTELAQNIGIQKAMIDLIKQQLPARGAGPTAFNFTEQQQHLLTTFLARDQEPMFIRVQNSTTPAKPVTPPASAASDATSSKPTTVPVKPAAAPTRTAPKYQTWNEITEGLVRQQQRLTKE